MNAITLIAGLIVGALMVALVMRLLLSIDRSDLTVSQGWLTNLEIQTRVTVEHELLSDGTPVLRHPDDETVRALQKRAQGDVRKARQLVGDSR